MDAAGHGEPVGEGQDGKEEVSEDSDSGQVIIELDQSQIASPSDSEEEGQIQESPTKLDISFNKPAQSEYFDAVSDSDDIPEDDIEPTTASSNESAAEPSMKVATQDDFSSAKDTLAEGSTGSLSQGSVAGTEGCEAAADSAKHKDEGESVDSCPQTTIANSGSADVAAKDSVVPEHVLTSSADRTDSVSITPDYSLVEKPAGEVSQDKVSSEEATCPEGLPDAAQGKGTNEENMIVKSSADLSAIADDVSDVSSEGESPLSPVEEEDKPSAEKLSQEAAHQAEALASLGAEPVSEPESGEDMGSDESSPVQSPGYSSPVVVTSSRISLGSGDYADARARATSRSPRKSDSAVISDCASSIQPTDRSDRLSLEDGIIPPTFSTSDNKLDLAASMDMENISDDENIGEDNDSEDTSGEIEDEPEDVKVDEAVSSSIQQTEDDGLKSSPGEKSVDGERVRRPIMIASLGDKQQVQTHFNEEQVELDYEDVDGDGDADEGEIKPEDGEDGKEEGEDSDKDEGEIDDDDDCEEGEIKEPGTSKKPFFKPTCRFYQRGTCTWGLNCRFLHPGVNDKGNYQMIELPGQRWNGPPGHMGGSQWGPEPEEPIDLPPPPEVPPIESAWERGLRHAKEQMKKASQRKEQESNFEEKRLNLSVDEEREMNKENERRMVVHAPIVKDPYYDQAAFDEEEYYKQRGINNWQSGRYENFEVRYNRESYSPYTREKDYYPPADRYPRHFSPPVDKFGRHPRMEPRPEPPYRSNRMEEIRALSPSPPVAAASPPSRRPADEWHDPWRRSKSPKANRRGRSRSRSRRGRRSLSDSSFSSDSRSGSRSSGSHSRSSRSRSSGSSRSRSRSPEPAPPGVDRGDRGDRNYGPPGRFMDGPRSAVSVRGRGGGSHWRDQDGRQGYHNRNRGGFQRGHHQDQRHRGGPSKVPERSFPPGYGYNRNRQPERRIPLDALRPKRTHSASSSSSSRSRSRSRSHSGSHSGSSSSFSRSRSGSARSRSLGSVSRSRSRSASSVSSHTSSSSTGSSGSADSDNLYRDLGGPSPKKKAVKGQEKEKEVGKVPRHPGQVPVGRGDRKRPLDPIPRRPGGAPPPPGADHAVRPPRPDLRPDGRADRPAEPRPDRANMERADPVTRMPHPARPDRVGNKVERAERAERADRGERPQRGERVDRPDRAERPDRADSRPERAERPEHAERERGMVGVKPTREQSSRPPPPSLQPKAKDPMKLIGLKSNIKLSLVSKPSDKAAVSNPLKRRPVVDAGDTPPAKRPALSASPVKMPSEKAAKPSAGRERVRSPSERQPRSGTAAIPASLPMAMAASIPLPPSPSKPPSAKPRPPPSKTPHPPPAASKPAPPQPVPTPASAPPPPPARATNATPAPAPTVSVAKAKKSTTSRREELLKQLKAVEDAIARKKAKMQ